MGGRCLRFTTAATAAGIFGRAVAARLAFKNDRRLHGENDDAPGKSFFGMQSPDLSRNRPASVDAYHLAGDRKRFITQKETSNSRDFLGFDEVSLERLLSLHKFNDVRIRLRSRAHGSAHQCRSEDVQT